MRTNRRIYGPNRKAEYLKEWRQRRKAAGLTIRGTVPIKRLAELGRQTLPPHIRETVSPWLNGHQSALKADLMKLDIEINVARNLILARANR